jgi:hypothetical protein
MILLSKIAVVVMFGFDESEKLFQAMYAAVTTER